MTEQEQMEQAIMQLKENILLAKVELYNLCQQYQDKYQMDLSVTIELPEPKKKRGRPRKVK